MTTDIQHAISSFNRVYPGHDLRLNGVQDFSPLDRPSMYWVTAWDGPAKTASFLVQDLNHQAIKNRLDDMIAMRK